MTGKSLTAPLLFGVLAVAVGLLGNPSPSAAQTVSGRILGTVRDSQGAVMPNVSVTAKSLETGTERTTTSDASGGFSISSVPAGVYQVTGTAPGFQTQTRTGLTVTVGAALRVDLSMTVGAVEQQVLVTGEAPQVDTTTSTMAGLVPDTTIRELPLNGRDWLQLAILQPGVMTATTQGQSGTLASNLSHGIGNHMSISGGRPSENVYRIDGLVVNDMTNDSPGSALGVNMGVDAIREFSVLTNTYSAEYGRGAGGVINAITKSGTNTLHGTGFEFLRNSAVDARNFFDRTLPPFRRNQFGASAGGPIKKDKLFFFGAYEGLRQFLSISFASNTLSPNARNGILASGTTVPVLPQVKPFLGLFPLPNGPISGDVGKYIFGAGQTGYEDYSLGRIDYQLSANTVLAGSYSFDRASTATPDNFNEKLTALQTRNQRIILSLQHVFSPTLLNTMRGGFNRLAGAEALDEDPRTPLLNDPSLGFVPGLNIGTLAVAGLDMIGGLGSTGANYYWYTAPQFNDDLSLVKGRHSIRIGFGVEDIRSNLNLLGTPFGAWRFGSVQDFLAANAVTFASDFTGTDTYRGVRTKIFGAYIQDDFRLRSNLTLNLGLRYEPSTVLSEINNRIARLRILTDAQPTIGNPLYANPTLRNFDPRIGVAWDPFGTGKTAVRTGFGTFDVVPLPNIIINKIARSAPFYEAGILVNPPASSFPNGATKLFGPSALSETYIEPNPHRAYKMQWNFNLQQQVTRGLSIMAGYVGSRGIHLPLSIQDTDQVPPPLVTKSPDGHYLFPTTGTIQRINPNYGSISSMQWKGSSIYHSLQVNVVQQLRHGISFQGVYAWSKNIDIGSAEYVSSDLRNSLESPWAFDPRLQRGPADFDIPQHLSLNFLWQAPSPHSGFAVSRFLLAGWELSGIFTAQSGTPFNVVFLSDQARTGNSFVPRSGQRPNFSPGPGCSSPNAINPGNYSNYVKFQCFSFPALGQLGNLGRNTLRSPGLEDFDFSLFKNHRLFNEKLTVQFRAELFNLFNRSNLSAGIITGFNSQGQVIPANSQLVPPTVTTSRQIQFGLKLIW